MAIQNLAGNFLPSPASNGRNLPQESARAPSASDNLVQRRGAVDLKPVVEIKPALTEKVENANSQKSQVSQEEVKNQIEELQQFNQSIDRSLQFQVDEELGVTIVRVIDKDTDELIRQFPPEELLNLSRRLKELNEQNAGHSGILLQEKV